MYASVVKPIGTLIVIAKVCKRCGQAFVLTPTEMNYRYEPEHCQVCRAKRRSERRG